MPPLAIFGRGSEKILFLVFLYMEAGAKRLLQFFSFSRAQRS